LPNEADLHMRSSKEGGRERRGGRGGGKKGRKGGGKREKTGRIPRQALSGHAGAPTNFNAPFFNHPCFDTRGREKKKEREGEGGGEGEGEKTENKS